MLLLVSTADTNPNAPDVVATPDDRRIVAALLAGDERTFAELVDRYNAPMLRLAMAYVRTPSAAEEVVGDTWVGVLRGLPSFEGRSSLKTWIFRILVNQAKTRGVRESRSVPFSSLGGAAEPAVGADRFLPEDDPAYAGHWAVPPRRWDDLPEARLLSAETREQVLAAIAELPPGQRDVITLRDVEGWSSAEVRAALDLSEANQRVLLHRARSKVRGRLERYLDEAAA
ncbi:MAG TPA: sigma-70 family RNA polymerase sigma factor [Gaiellales bacterium]